MNRTTSLSGGEDQDAPRGLGDRLSLQILHEVPRHRSSDDDLQLAFLASVATGTFNDLVEGHAERRVDGPEAT